MKNVFKVFGIAVLALIGCFMAGCDNGTTGPGPGPAPLKFTGEQVYESTSGTITGQMGDIAASLDLFQNASDDSNISDYFTGSAAITGGKITVNLTPIVSALEDFNARYDDTTDSEELCPGDVKGLMFAEISDGEGITLGLGKTDADDKLTHTVIFIYVDRDTTFTGDNGDFVFNGIEAKKGWNYISANLGTGVCEKITGLSGYRWVNW